ncbi:hypothetical protein DEO72_LG6g907 [Vigna unguiculata]|uniref:Uncharacterized protein n=1 Tax=Vigna unguiculata TaxID=3917 RepID=A0A4D6M4V9_VIGUN|nr:hypothetical protein DEO72_LG6g907 [Vigna unguiculata]
MCRAHVERCNVRGGPGLVDHRCWTTGGQVRRDVYKRQGFNRGAQSTEVRLAACRAPPGSDEKMVALERRWRLAVRGYRQAVWHSFA